MRKCLSLYHSAKLHNGSNSRLLQASDGPLHWLNTLRLGTGGQVRCFAEAEALQDELPTDRCWPIWHSYSALRGFWKPYRWCCQGACCAGTTWLPAWMAAGQSLDFSVTACSSSAQLCCPFNSVFHVKASMYRNSSLSIHTITKLSQRGRRP